MFELSSCGSSPSNSLPATPVHEPYNLTAPRFADDEQSVGASFSSSDIPKHMITELALGPPVLTVPIPSSSIPSGASAEKSRHLIQHPRRVESQIQLYSSATEEFDQDLIEFNNLSDKRRSQSSPIVTRNLSFSDIRGHGSLMGLFSRKDGDAFDLLESEENDIYNEFAGDIELGRRGLPSACVFVANLAMHRQDKQLQESVFKFFSKFAKRVHVKIRRDGKNMPYAFVQYETEAEACHAIKEARGALLDSRRIRCEQARVNRTIVLTKRDGSDLGEEEARAMIEEHFGPYEMMKFVGDANTGKKYCFVKFIYRGDAIDCYGVLRHDNIWNADWENDHVRAQSAAQLPTPAVEVDHTSIFVGNLNPELINKEELVAKFSQYGKILDCNLINNKKGENQDKSTTRNAFAFIKYESEENALRAISAEMNSQYLGKFLHVQKRELHDKYYRNIPSPSDRRMSNEMVNDFPNARYQPNQVYQQPPYTPRKGQQQFRQRMPPHLQGELQAAMQSNSSLAEIVSMATKISLQMLGHQDQDPADIIKTVLGGMSLNDNNTNSPSSPHPSGPIPFPVNYNSNPSTPTRNGNGHANSGFGSPYGSPNFNRPRHQYNSYSTSPSQVRSPPSSPQYHMPNRGAGFRRNLPQHGQQINSDCTGGGVYLPGMNQNRNGMQYSYNQDQFSPVLCSPSFSPHPSHSRRNSVYINRQRPNPNNYGQQTAQNNKISYESRDTQPRRIPQPNNNA